ncbi:tetraspanin-9 [Chrysoperla carnea]|uniref:tetraspanin-9 n=1 Tax=Chrysoperla carnea TaxID=189513 RepID=UPI001D07930F|nr:tetraspanin-9 [Chrysoperla carnea]
MGRSGYTCVRHIFCWLNFILWLSGSAFLGLGIYLRVVYAGYTSLVPQYSLAGADILCIAIGIVMFIIAFTGCCGAWMHSRCLLVLYFSMVILMFILEFSTASLSFIFRDRLSYIVRGELINGIEKHYNVSDDQPNSLVHIWDHIQNEFHCCGVVNYEDWYDISAWPGLKQVPDSCCKPEFVEEGCGHDGLQDHWYKKGCSDQVQMWLVQRLHILGIVGLVVAFIQLFGLISSMLLFCTVRHKRTSHTYRAYDRTT